MHETLKRKYLHRPDGGQIYFRFGGRLIERLPDDDTSPEFAIAYDRLIAQFKPGKVGRPRQGTGRPMTVTRHGVTRYGPPSIGWFAEQWLTSDFFAPTYKTNTQDRPFRDGTQQNYRLGLNLLRSNGLMDIPLLDLNPRTGNLYIQRVKRERGGAAAKVQKNILSNIWKFATRLPQFNPGDRSNPMQGGNIEAPYAVRQEHEPWPDDVQQRFLKACDINLVLGFHLLLCTGQRVSDVTKMKWRDYDGSHITLVQKKTKTPITIRAPKILQVLLTQRERVSDYILTHKWRRPYTRETLSHAIKDILNDNGDGAYTTHGLRKNAGIMLAENGATVPQIMAALGHKTPTMALYYVRLANQRPLADQAADILDGVFERRGRRGALRVVE